MEISAKRGKLIRQLEDALTLAEEIGDAKTEHLIERALDERAPTNSSHRPLTD